MSRWFVLLVAVVGLLVFVAGVALVFVPAALMVFGAACVAWALLVEVRDT